jgi:hypothetical protein
MYRVRQLNTLYEDINVLSVCVYHTRYNIVSSVFKLVPSVFDSVQLHILVVIYIV